jgi:hypothetical protein
MNSRRNLVAIGAVAASLLVGGALPAAAQYPFTVGQALSLSCENGRTYALTPRSSTLAGDVVTGYLRLSPRRSVHVRLVPMGVGYRYIARGIWLDGVRSEAVLHFGKRTSVACTVAAV